MAYRGLYNSNGQINLTVVAGTTYTGLYSADGCWNVVLTTENTTIKGRYAPCGAFWATVTDSYSASYYAADGSMNIIANSDGSFSPVQPNGQVLSFVRADTTKVTSDSTIITADYLR